MAGIAFQVMVSTLKREIGVAAMIKYQAVPPGCLMTLLALLSESPTMPVIQHVACKTLIFRVLVTVVRMAGITGDQCVSVSQSKTGFSVVKAHFRPGHHLMAGIAGLAQAALVEVILLVALMTIRRCFPEGGSRPVTVIAECCGMGTLESKVRESVIKRFAIETDDIAFSAFMFRMATVTTRRVLEQVPVKSCAALDISEDRFMTFQTGRSRTDFPRPVAGFAVGLNPGMRL